MKIAICGTSNKSVTISTARTFVAGDEVIMSHGMKTMPPHIFTIAEDISGVDGDAKVAKMDGRINSIKLAILHKVTQFNPADIDEGCDGINATMI